MIFTINGKVNAVANQITFDLPDAFLLHKIKTDGASAITNPIKDPTRYPVI